MVAQIYMCMCITYVHVYVSRNRSFSCTDAVLIMSDIDLTIVCQKDAKQVILKREAALLSGGCLLGTG